MPTRPRRAFNPANAVSITAAHLVAAFGVWYAFARGYSAASWILFFTFTALTGFGITIGYHRMLTHRSFQCGGVLRVFLALCGGMAGQGHEYAWVANHRVHHYFSDQELDPHSPRAYPGIKGLLWAHVLWLFYDYERPARYKTFVDLEMDPVVKWQRRLYLPIVVGAFLIAYLVAGWQGVLLGGFVRLVWVWNVTWSVNSICHRFGEMAKDSDGRAYFKDDSRNNLLVAIFGFGEGYHANHHARMAWAYHGWRKFDLDSSKWIIQILERLNLIWDVKKPTLSIRFSGRELEESLAEAVS